MNRKDRRAGKSKDSHHQNNIQILFEDALQHHNAGRLVEAETLYKRILQLDLQHHPSLHQFGMIAYQAGRYDVAVQLISEAIKVRDDIPLYHFNLGKTFEALKKNEEAKICFKRALTLDAHDIKAANNLGMILFSEGRYEEARQLYDYALQLNPLYPEALTNLGLYNLLHGNLKEGFRLHESRTQIAAAPDYGFDKPPWDGHELKGKRILLHCEQGYGDNIQFIRYASAVKNKGGYVILPCFTPLVRLFETVEGIDEINQEGQDLPPYDYYASLLSLPYLLGTDVTTIPAYIPYIHVNPNLKENWQARLKDCKGMKIGVAWRGNPKHVNDHKRSIDPALFAKAFAGIDATIVILQKDCMADELRLFGNENIMNAGATIEDFADLAALMTNLDLVISVDTAICHLAGALGLKVWTLLAYVPDWRWMLERDDSPWYPSMRLFRQRISGEWQEVLAEIRQSLAPG